MKKFLTWTQEADKSDNWTADAHGFRYRLESQGTDKLYELHLFWQFSDGILLSYMNINLGVAGDESKLKRWAQAHAWAIEALCANKEAAFEIERALLKSALRDEDCSTSPATRGEGEQAVKPSETNWREVVLRARYFQIILDFGLLENTGRSPSESPTHPFRIPLEAALEDGRKACGTVYGKTVEEVCQRALQWLDEHKLPSSPQQEDGK